MVRKKYTYLALLFPFASLKGIRGLYWRQGSYFDGIPQFCIKKHNFDHNTVCY